MSPPEELTQLYGQWRLLTEQEGAAIDRGSWLQVAQCQSAKSRLQPRIEEISGGMDAGFLEREFRPVVTELIELERGNSRRLKDRRREAEAVVGDCDRSCRSLREIQRRYGPSSRQHWQSYS